MHPNYKMSFILVPDFVENIVSVKQFSGRVLVVRHNFTFNTFGCFCEMKNWTLQKSLHSENNHRILLKFLL